MNYQQLKKRTARGQWQVHKSGDHEASLSIANRVIAVLRRRDVPKQNMDHAKLVAHCVNNFDKALVALKEIQRREDKRMIVGYDIHDLIAELETVE